MNFDLAPSVNVQVTTNMQKAILSGLITPDSILMPFAPENDVDAQPPLLRPPSSYAPKALPITCPSLVAALQETTMDSLRNAYIGFDFPPSQPAFNSALAVSPKVTSSKRARSPSSISGDLKGAEKVESLNPTQSSSQRKVLEENVKTPFQPSAVVDPPDYQGRSFLFPPTIDLNVAKAVRLPKRMLCVGNGHKHGVQVLKYAMPYAHLFFAGDVGGTVKVWNPSTAATMRAPLATYHAHSLPITALCVAEEGRRLTTSGHDGFVRLWDAETGVVTNSIVHKGMGCSEHVLHPEDNNMVLAAFDKEVALFDLRISGASAASNKAQRLYQGHMGGIMSVAFLNSRGHMFATSSSDKTIRTWDFRVPVQIRQLGDPSMHAVAHLLKHPTEDVLLAQSADNKVRVFDIDDNGRLRVMRDRTFVGHTVSGTSCKLSISRDGQFVSSGDATGQVYVWNYSNGEIARKFHAHSSQCSAHMWHPHEATKMVTGGWDCLVKVWV